jgi:hypothetical protein
VGKLQFLPKFGFLAMDGGFQFQRLVCKLSSDLGHGRSLQLLTGLKAAGQHETAAKDE